MPDVEVIELPGGGKLVGIHAPDIGVHPPGDILDQMFHLSFGAFHHQFNPTIGKIADITANVVLKGDVLDGVPETHALHAAGEIAGAAMRQVVGLR